MSDHYLLDPTTGDPVKVDDLLEWARYFERSNCQIALDVVGHRRVSTVFLGIDHNFTGGQPLLFETLVFPECERCERYSTKGAAIVGHNRIVSELREARDG